MDGDRKPKRDITTAVHNVVWCVLALAVVVVIEFLVRYSTGTIDGWWAQGWGP